MVTTVSAVPTAKIIVSLMESQAYLSVRTSPKFSHVNSLRLSVRPSANADAMRMRTGGSTSRPTMSSSTRENDRARRLRPTRRSSGGRGGEGDCAGGAGLVDVTVMMPPPRRRVRRRS